jgi:diketogulonate reductase-like aldo/keto reductase
VTNFDVMDLIELWKPPAGPDAHTDHVLYNLSQRSPECQLLPWCHEENLPVMTCSPIEQGRILSHPAVRAVAEQHAATPAHVAVARVIRQRRICAIAKSGSRSHTSRRPWPRSASVLTWRICTSSTWPSRHR